MASNVPRNTGEKKCHIAIPCSSGEYSGNKTENGATPWIKYNGVNSKSQWQANMAQHEAECKVMGTILKQEKKTKETCILTIVWFYIVYLLYFNKFILVCGQTIFK